jgi:hypothetical protein
MFVFELACFGPADAARAARDWHDAAAADWRILPGLIFHDLYVGAADAEDPLVDDGPGPLLIAMLAFADEQTLALAIAGAAFAAPLARLPHGVRAAGEAMECRHYPVPGAAAPAELHAPFSYMVRYHRPAADEAAFIANYVATHPPTLARLPDIRNIMCYFPLDRGNPPGLAKAGYVAAFNRAMASPVRRELRAHYRAFPPFSGANTHYPMLRTRMITRSNKSGLTRLGGRRPGSRARRPAGRRRPQR